MWNGIFFCVIVHECTNALFLFLPTCSFTRHITLVNSSVNQRDDSMDLQIFLILIQISKLDNIFFENLMILKLPNRPKDLTRLSWLTYMCTLRKSYYLFSWLGTVLYCIWWTVDARVFNVIINFFCYVFDIFMFA